MFQFLIFVVFSFFIPLLLMNMLIAIMSSAYERIQENSEAADARMLAELQLEYEEVITYFVRQGQRVRHYFLFFSQVQEAEEEVESLQTVQNVILERVDEHFRELKELVLDMSKKINS